MSTGLRFSAGPYSSAYLDVKGTFEKPRGFAPLRNGILLLDRLLRRKLGIYEFTANSECLLRIATTYAQTEMRFSEGASIRPSDPLIELHFWNEHLEPLLALKAPWARTRLIGRRLELSLSLLAAYLVAHPEIEAEIIHGRVVMPLGQRFVRFKAIAERYGFSVTTSPARGLARWHDFLEVFLVHGLRWAFNPAPATHRTLRLKRADLWIDRDTLVARYLGFFESHAHQDVFLKSVHVNQSS